MNKSKDENSQRSTGIFICIFLVLIIVSSTLLVLGIRENTITKVSMVNKTEYLKEKVEKSEGKVIVNYIDEKGNEILESETITGKVGEEYDIDLVKAEGYILENVPVNKSGNFDFNDQEVNFVYTKDNTTVATDSTGKAVTVTVYKNKHEELTEYKARIKTVNKKGEVITGASYKVTNSNSQVVKTGTDVTGNFLIGSFVINKEGTSQYKIIETNSQKGYEKLSDFITLSVIKSLLPDSTDVYTATAQISDMENVKIEIDNKNKEFIITIEKDIEKIVTPEPTPEPEPEPTKVFDLEIEKTIKNVTVKVNGSEKLIEKKSKDSLVKVDVPKEKLNETELIIVYTIDVKNVGEVPGYATCITDNIPTGMTLVENEEWKLSDTIATNTTYDSKIINPGETISSDITLKMKLSEENIGTKENEALITTYYNDLGLKDNTPDNSAKEPLLVTIKTGKKAVITVSALVALSSFVGLVYKIKEND